MNTNTNPQARTTTETTASFAKKRFMSYDNKKSNKRSQYIDTVLPEGLVAMAEQALSDQPQEFKGFCYAFIEIVYVQSRRLEADWCPLMGKVLRQHIPDTFFKRVRDFLVDHEVIYYHNHYKPSSKYGKKAHACHYRIAPYEPVVSTEVDALVDVTTRRLDYPQADKDAVIVGALGYEITDEVFSDMMDAVEVFFEKKFDNVETDQEHEDTVLKKQYYVKQVHDLYVGHIWSTRSTVNDRVHHNFTNLPTILVEVLQKRFDLVEFDVKNSQISLLSSVFPSLIGTQFDEDAATGIVYEKIMYDLNSTDRKVGKAAVIQALFSSTYNGKDERIQSLERLYPELMQEIEYYKNEVEDPDEKQTKLAVVLQQIEANYMIDLVFADERLVDVPCFTRHDSIVAPAKHEQLVKFIIKEKFDFNCTLQCTRFFKESGWSKQSITIEKK